MIKVFRICVVLLFLIVALLFGMVYVTEYKQTDNTLPVITISEDKLELSIKDSDKKLLEGVTAYDEKDGDITKNVIVESVSKFIKGGICKVTYAVCDSSNHVATATRKVVYTDYKSPTFTLNRPLCYSLYEGVNIKSAISVKDCFDGSLDSNVIITSPDFTSATEGVFTIEASVTNSKGDIAKIKLPLIIEDRSLSAPNIKLKKYLVYLDKGDELDLEDNVDEIIDKDDQKLKAKVKIDTNVNYDKDGTYTVHYYAKDKEGNEGHSVLVVIVGSGYDEG